MADSLRSSAGAMVAEIRRGFSQAKLSNLYVLEEQIKWTWRRRDQISISGFSSSSPSSSSPFSNLAFSNSPTRRSPTLFLKPDASSGLNHLLPSYQDVEIAIITRKKLNKHLECRCFKSFSNRPTMARSFILSLSGASSINRSMK